MTTPAEPLRDDYKLRRFFLLSFGISWLVWISMIIFSPGEDYFLPLLFMGAFGPSLAAICMVLMCGSIEERKSFWKSLIDVKRIGLKWFLFILLIFPTILFLGYFLYSLVGGSYPNLADYFGGIETISDALSLLFIMLLGGPLAEELGWRGYALDRLRPKWGLLMGSIILGIIWVLWHLPLFFIEGTSQFQKGFGPAFWSWAFQLIVISLIFSLVYYKTGESILAAILLHLMANIAYPLNLDETGEFIFTLLRLCIGIVVAFNLISFEKTSVNPGIKSPGKMNVYPF